MRSCFAVMLALLLVSSASAQTRSLSVEGVEGVWFPKPSAEKLLGDVRALPAYVERVRLLEEDLTHHKTMLDLQAQLITNTRAQLSEVVKISETQQVDLQECHESLRAWYWNPSLWFMGGVLASGIALLIAVRNLD